MSDKKICPIMTKPMVVGKHEVLYEVECKREECALWQIQVRENLCVVKHEGCKLGRK